MGSSLLQRTLYLAQKPALTEILCPAYTLRFSIIGYMWGRHYSWRRKKKEGEILTFPGRLQQSTERVSEE